MIELRGILDYHKQMLELAHLPIKVQEKVKEILIILDESYGEVETRVFEGGKVILLKDQEEVRQMDNMHDLAMHEYADEIHTEEGIYLMVLLLHGTENNIMLVGKKEIIEAYL